MHNTVTCHEENRGKPALVKILNPTLPSPYYHSMNTKNKYTFLPENNNSTTYFFHFRNILVHLTSLISIFTGFAEAAK